MIKTIVSQVPSGNKDIVAINNDYNCGQIIVDIKESEYTDTMKHELLGLLFRLYVKVDEDYVSFNGKTVLWNSGSDVSLPIYDIPQSSYILVEPIIDEVYLENNNLNPTEVFPITVHFNDEDISTHNNAEDVTNKVTEINSDNTDEEYPSAAATYEYGQKISDELNAEIDRTEAVLNEEIDSTEARLNGEIDATETRLNEEIDTTEDRLNSRISDVEEDFRHLLNDAEIRIDGKMDTADAVLSLRIHDTDKRLDSVEENLGKEIDATEAQLGQDISDAEKRLNDEIDNTEESLNNAIDSLGDNLSQKIDGSISSLEESLNAELESTESEFDSKLAESESKFDTKLSETETEFDTKLSETEGEFDSKLASMRSEFNQELDNTERELDSKFISEDEFSGKLDEATKELEEKFLSDNELVNALAETESEFDDKLAITKAELINLLKPHVIVEVPEGTEGLYAQNNGVDDVEWQLTGFDLSPYRKLKFYIRSGGDSSSNETCAEVVVMHLDRRALNSVTGNCYLASGCTQHANDAGKIFLNTFAVSEDKTKIAFLRSTSITFGTSHNYSGKDRYCYLIEGYLI